MSTMHATQHHAEALLTGSVVLYLMQAGGVESANQGWGFVIVSKCCTYPCQVSIHTVICTFVMLYFTLYQ